MWWHAVWYAATNVSYSPAASIFREEKEATSQSEMSTLDRVAGSSETSVNIYKIIPEDNTIKIILC